MDESLIPLVKKLFLVFRSAYTHRWTSAFVNEADIKFALGIWGKALENYSEEVIKQAIDRSLLQFSWPPSLAEFCSLCDKFSGLPEQADVLKRLIDRDLSHPVTKFIYDKIGDWALRSDSQKQLEKKISEHYENACMGARKINFLT